MTVTEELRRMLDERGVDYRVSATGYSIDIGPYTTAYANRSDTTLDVSLRQVTPEQAIAATLGDSEYERKMDALLCRLTNGKFSKTRAYDLDFMESVVREEFETDAAALEAGACHLEEVDKDCDSASEYMIEREWCFDAVYRCSCGCRFGHVAHERPKFCPNCGRRVVDE